MAGEIVALRWLEQDIVNQMHLILFRWYRDLRPYSSRRTAVKPHVFRTHLFELHPIHLAVSACLKIGGLRSMSLRLNIYVTHQTVRRVKLSRVEPRLGLFDRQLIVEIASRQIRLAVARNLCLLKHSTFDSTLSNLAIGYNCVLLSPAENYWLKSRAVSEEASEMTPQHYARGVLFVACDTRHDAEYKSEPRDVFVPPCVSES